MSQLEWVDYVFLVGTGFSVTLSDTDVDKSFLERNVIANYSVSVIIIANMRGAPKKWQSW